MSILLLGASGYIGSAIFAAMQKRGVPGIAVSRKQIDYTNREELVTLLNTAKPGWVINAAAYIPQPSVDLCKNDPEKTFRANVVFPSMLAVECAERGIALGQIGTACLFDDAREYTEEDKPTRDFNSYCGVYLEGKWLAEKMVSIVCPRSYVWRIRLPFDNLENLRNYLTKLRSHEHVWSHINSLTHRGDFANAALNMIERKVPWGIYNCCNGGSIPAVEIISDMVKHGLVTRVPKFGPGPVTGSRLSTAKLEAMGCGMRNVEDAIEESLRTWVV